MKKILIPLFLLLFLTVAGGGFYFWFHGVTQKIFVTKNITASAEKPHTIAQYLSSKTPFNIALLGYGGGMHDGAYLTDSIMLVHIDPKAQKIFLVSIPRDSWVKIPTDGSSGMHAKINTAYGVGMDDTNYPNKLPQFKSAAGIGNVAEYVLSQVTGVPINNYVGMDFSGFEKTINTLGGVDVDVKIAFTDYQYPIAGNEDDPCGHSADEIKTFTATDSAEMDLPAFFPCRYQILHFDTGLQHMDGARALAYVRSRHSAEDGTDFGRAQRQRNLLIAVKQKVFSAGFIPQILPFMTSLGDDFKTDLTMDDVRTLLQNAPTLDTYKITTLALTDQNYLMDTVSSDGQDILAPDAGIDNWSVVHTWLADEFSGKPLPTSAVVEVENGTNVLGLATKAADALKKENIQVLTPGNADNSHYKKTQIIVYNKNVDAKDIASLKKIMGIITVSYETSTQTMYNVLVIVGNDYTAKNHPTASQSAE